METPPSGRCSVQSPSKKRVFPGGSSGSKLVKQKEVAISSSADVLGQESYDDDFPFPDEYDMATSNGELTIDKDEALQKYLDSNGIPTGEEVSIPWFLVPSHPDKPQPEAKTSSSSSLQRQTALLKLGPSFDLDLDSPPSPVSSPVSEPSSFGYQYPMRPPTPPPYLYGNYYGGVPYLPRPPVLYRPPPGPMPPPPPLPPVFASVGAPMPPVWFSSGWSSPFSHSGAFWNYQFPEDQFNQMSGNGDGSSVVANGDEKEVDEKLPPLPPMPPVPASAGAPMPPMWFSTGFHGLPFSNGGGEYWGYHFPVDLFNQNCDGSSVIAKVDEREVVEKFQNFKQFDTVEDFSDHHFQSSVLGGQQPQRYWVKKVQKEWKILETNIPDTICVRVCESKMDLLRAVIVGAEGTPYHDGLFFFDIFFPSDFPHVPPMVHYHSGGLGINPNMYPCGKVCLSLLNTWHGDNENQQWVPHVSTILQVLISIQALILNARPFFNEPGLERMDGSPYGEVQSQQYNKRIFTFSLKTMVYSIKKPPQHFEDFIMGHFFNRAERVLSACKAYMEGAQVGSLVNGEAQNIDSSNKRCSESFAFHLGSYIPTLVKTFSQIGVKDLDKFPFPADKGNNGQVVPSVHLP